MPELPEIEHLRRSLEPLLLGAVVTGVRVIRGDVIRRTSPAAATARTDHTGSTGRGRCTRTLATELLRGDTITSLQRHGKQLAIGGASGGVMCIHLGMSGQFRFVGPRQRIDPATHVHAIWSLADQSGAAMGRLLFRDPRRFGGIWLFPSCEELVHTRWSALGPDALTITPSRFRSAMERTRSPIKAALLNQSLIAGLGNIYVDESLHRARVHPLEPAQKLNSEALSRLHFAIRRTLTLAIKAGGTTLRDYLDGRGTPGDFRYQHCVYGLADHPCRRCGTILDSMQVSGRTTTFCPRCQERDSHVGMRSK